MKTNRLFKSSAIILISSVTLVSSCNDEERITVQDTQDITEEALTDSYFQDMDDMGGVAIEAPTSDQYSGGRAKGTYTLNIQDDRFKCAGIVVTLTTTGTAENPQGTIVVDFGTAGCEDLRGNVRTGKLIFAYNGRRFNPGSTIIITPENYSINDVKLSGVRTSTNVQASVNAAPRYKVVLTDGKAIDKDGSVAERESEIIWEWTRATNPADDKLIIDQSSRANGTTRGGRNYEVSLLKSLEYKRFCGMAVTGTKKYVIGGSKEITIDYGDGTCDKAITISVNGVTRNINVN